MTPDEVRELLSVAAGYDNRRTDDDAVTAWAESLSDPRVPNLALSEAVDAVIMHYREHTDRLMPAHILTYVKAERRTQMSRALPAGTTDPATYERVGGMWRQAYAEAEARRQAQRAAVLAHPDLAGRLTAPPLGYSRPEQWNGGVPPKYGPADSGGRVKANDSTRRAALVELVEEAARRNGSPA